MTQQHHTPARGDGEEPDAPVPAAVQANTQAVDDLLDEIDGLLAENAEDFVTGFVQKGGE